MWKSILDWLMTSDDYSASSADISAGLGDGKIQGGMTLAAAIRLVRTTFLGKPPGRLVCRLGPRGLSNLLVFF